MHTLNSSAHILFQDTRQKPGDLGVPDLLAVHHHIIVKGAFIPIIQIPSPGQSNTNEKKF